MRAIQKKIRSQRGASITFALLLFLVCAVLSSVVIVAATSASGRISKLAESDQRYYAVTSAAELLRDVMKDKSVSIVKVTKSYSTATYTDGIPGETLSDYKGTERTEPTTDEYIISGFEKTRASDIQERDLREECRVKNGNDLESLSMENTAGLAYLNTKSAEKELVFTSDYKVGKTNEDPLQVTVRAYFAPDGGIRFTDQELNGLSLELNANAGESSYTSYLQLDPQNHTEWETTEGEGESAYTVPHYSETVTTEMTEIVLTTLTWNMTNENP